jgi:hypothetical protein
MAAVIVSSRGALAGVSWRGALDGGSWLVAAGSTGRAALADVGALAGCACAWLLPSDAKDSAKSHKTP